MRRLKKLMAGIVLGVALSFGAPQALADDGPVEMPGAHGPVEMPGGGEPTAAPGVVSTIITIIISTIPVP